MAQQNTPIRIAVIGGGAFGRNHIRIYSELAAAVPDGAQFVCAVEPNTDRAAELTTEFGIQVIASFDDFVARIESGELRVDAASICVPTVHHAAVARRLLSLGIDLLIEKPIAATLDEADEIISLARAAGRIVQVGHLERFNPAVTELAPHLNGPMFFEAHRLSIFTPRSLDVDVVLDLMIHDLDVVLALTQSPVKEVRAVGLPVLSRMVDIANVRVEFESGCVANFTASRVSTERVRKLRFFQPQEYVSVDYARQEALFIHVSQAAATQIPAELAHPSAGLSFKKLDVTPGEPLRFELADFLDCVRTRRAPRVDAAQGRAALALALEINAVIEAHARRAGLDRYR